MSQHIMGEHTTMGEHVIMGERVGAERRGTSLSLGAKAFDLVRNAMLLLGLYLAYAVVRRLTADEWGTAHLNADRLLDFQRAIGLPSEASLQRGFFLDRPSLVRAANTFYLWAHFPATGAFLVWVWWKHRHRFAAVRNTLIILTGGGLILHVVFPLAPPRMKPSEGFVDTASLFGPNPYEFAGSEAANQIAAMPSLHVGWAVLAAISVIALSRSRFRYLAVIHPVVTTSVVILTANHYFADAIIAIILVIGAWLYVAKLSDVSDFPGVDHWSLGPTNPPATVLYRPVIDIDRIENEHLRGQERPAAAAAL